MNRQYSIFDGAPMCVVEPMLFSRSASRRDIKILKNAKGITCKSAKQIIRQFAIDGFYTDLLGHYTWVLVLYCQEKKIPFSLFFGLDSRIIIEYNGERRTSEKNHGN